jgi:hypothetical protein
MRISASLALLANHPIPAATRKHQEHPVAAQVPALAVLVALAQTVALVAEVVPATAHSGQILARPQVAVAAAVRSSSIIPAQQARLASA